MKNASLRFVSLGLCTVLAIALFAATAAAEKPAEPGKSEQQVVLQRPGADGEDKGPLQSFDHELQSLFQEAAESCSGACNCSECVCSGSFECCLGGCVICWDVACGPV